MLKRSRICGCGWIPSSDVSVRDLTRASTRWVTYGLTNGIFLLLTSPAAMAHTPTLLKSGTVTGQAQVTNRMRISSASVADTSMRH